MPAGSAGYSLYVLRGLDARTGQYFLCTDGLAVGHGARPTADGHRPSAPGDPTGGRAAEPRIAELRRLNAMMERFHATGKFDKPPQLSGVGEQPGDQAPAMKGRTAGERVVLAGYGDAEPQRARCSSSGFCSSWNRRGYSRRLVCGSAESPG